MRKRLFVFAIVVAILCVGTLSSIAQVPYIAVFFDPGMTETAKNCPGPSIVDTVYVGAMNFGMWMQAIEFTIDYSWALQWVQDIPYANLKIGSSPTGITLGWTIPANAFNPLLVMEARVLWLCNDCSVEDIPVLVNPYPGQTSPRATRWPDVVVVEAVGMESRICSTIPVEDTTWGQVKSLYTD